MTTRKPPHQAARGLERTLCWIVIVALSIQIVVTLVVALTSPEFELHWVYVVAPPIFILIGIGRLTGWVKPGTGFG